jgi:hypothetical protein
VSCGRGEDDSAKPEVTGATSRLQSFLGIVSGVGRQELYADPLMAAQ